MNKCLGAQNVAACRGAITSLLADHGFSVRILPSLANGTPCIIGGPTACAGASRLPYELLHADDRSRARFACDPRVAFKAGLPVGRCDVLAEHITGTSRLSADQEIAMQASPPAVIQIPFSSPSDEEIRTATRLAAGFRALVDTTFVGQFDEKRVVFDDLSGDMLRFVIQYLSAHAAGLQLARELAKQLAIEGKKWALDLAERLSDEGFSTAIFFLLEGEQITLDLAPFEKLLGLPPVGSLAMAIVFSCWRPTGAQTAVETLVNLVGRYEIASGGEFDRSMLREVKEAHAAVLAAKEQVPASVLAGLRESIRRVDVSSIRVSATTAAGVQTWSDFALDAVEGRPELTVAGLLDGIAAFAAKADRLRLANLGQGSAVLIAKVVGSGAAEETASVTTDGDSSSLGGGDCRQDVSMPCAECDFCLAVGSSPPCPSCNGFLGARSDLCECGFVREGTWVCSGCGLTNRGENERCRYRTLHGCMGLKSGSRPFDPANPIDKKTLQNIKAVRQEREQERAREKGNSTQRGKADNAGGKARGGRKRA
jgi:hypothetical protein